jgi:hypothetical protein
LAPFAPPAAAEDVRGALERLSNESAVERQAAERWLASNLDPEDLETVAEVGATAGLEARTRLANALGSDDRHFGLAALLAADYEPELRRIGNAALERMIARWYGEAELVPTPVEAVEQAMANRFSGRLYSMTVGERSLDEEVAAVARILGRPEGLRSAGAILGIVVDPLLYERHLEGRPPGPATLRGAGPRHFEGTADVMLLATALWRERLTVEGFGFDGPHAWVHVVDHDQARTRTGGALLVAWCRGMLEYPDRPEGEGAARALAGTGWPAPLAWMAQRWFEHGDRNALAGLLLAAERGRVVAGLATERSVERLLRAADRALVERPRSLEFPEEVLRAIGAMGPVGSDGADLAAVVARGWEQQREPAARLRLGILCEMGRAPESVRVRLREILAGGEAPVSDRFRFEMLRTLAATATGTGDATWTAHDPEALWRAGAELDLEHEAYTWLLRARARPPAAWRDPAALPASLGLPRRTRTLDWWLEADASGAVAGAHLLALTPGLNGAPEERVGETLALRVRRGDRARVEAALAAAREGGGAEATLGLDRLALLAGLLPEERHLALFEALVQGGTAPPDDLALVAVLAASSPAAEPARLALAAAVAADEEQPSGLGMEAPWVRAYARAIRTLQRSARGAEGAQEAETRLRKDLREEMRRSRHPLAERLRTEDWPPPPGLEPVSIGPLEVHLGL